MRRRALATLALLLLIGTLPTAVAAWPGAQRARSHQLEGAWKLVGTLAEDEDAIEPPAPGSPGSSDTGTRSSGRSGTGSGTTSEPCGEKAA